MLFAQVRGCGPRPGPADVSSRYILNLPALAEFPQNVVLAFGSLPDCRAQCSE